MYFHSVSSICCDFDEGFCYRIIGVYILFTLCLLIYSVRLFMTFIVLNFVRWTTVDKYYNFLINHFIIDLVSDADFLVYVGNYGDFNVEYLHK